MMSTFTVAILAQGTTHGPMRSRRPFAKRSIPSAFFLVTIFVNSLQRHAKQASSIDIDYVILEDENQFSKKFQLGGVTPSCHPSGGWSVKCMCSHYVLLAALMARPDQVGTPQGQRSVSCDVPVDNDWGTGSGWQQSKQNPTVSSVVG